MNHNYIQVIACVLLSISGYSLSIAQSSGPEFLVCSSTPDSLCVQDEGVRLPANNQFFLGEEDPEATSCSVHVTQKKRVRSNCGDTLQYEVQLFIHDTSAAYLLKPLTTVTTDSLGEAELIFNTEEAVDEFISSSGIPYGTGCLPYHRIKWIVTDSCGHESICEQSIQLYDCDAPTISIVTPTTYFFSNSGYINMYAKDLVITQDDCTLSEEFQISFDSLSYQPIKEFYYCDIPVFGFELSYDIWIADHGADSNCDGDIAWKERNIEKKEVKIVFEDNTVTIECSPDVLIAGEVRTEYMQGIKDVEVEFSTSGQDDLTYLTGPDGNYVFLTAILNGEANISVNRNDFHKNGVSTLDLVKIQKHLLGKDTLDSPYQIIAADANNSQNVSAIDLVELKKLILGVYTELPANQSWRFVPTEYVFPDPLDPWTDTIAPWSYNGGGTITITDPENPGNLDFIGIKIGDVNGTAQPNATQLLPRGSLTPFNLVADPQSYRAGDIINVPIRMSADQKLTGFQFTLNAEGMEILNIIPGQVLVSEEHCAVFNDKMTISWFDQNTVDISFDDVLFTIQLRATRSGNIGQTLSINSEITEAEIYLANDVTFLPFLRVQDQHDEDKLHIISCAPNPWKAETTINFILPESDEVSFTLVDISGRELYSTTKYFKSGHHQYQLRASDFQAKGMVLFEIKTSKHTDVIKLIVAE